MEDPNLSTRSKAILKSLVELYIAHGLPVGSKTIANLPNIQGSSATIRIRGGNSITAGNEPLYVIDGFVGAGDLSTLNPNDIESIQILKGIKRHEGLKA